ncbi:unnamed protein product [Brassica oleracea]
MFSELMRKFDALSEHIKRLDGQVAENAAPSKERQDVSVGGLMRTRNVRLISCY